MSEFYQSYKKYLEETFDVVHAWRRGRIMFFRVKDNSSSNGFNIVINWGIN